MSHGWPPPPPLNGGHWQGTPSQGWTVCRCNLTDSHVPTVVVTETRWSPTAWWRVVDASGSVWAETSDEEDARMRLRSAPGGGYLYRLWRSDAAEWRQINT